jgi:Nif-specific regulatory protein
MTTPPEQARLRLQSLIEINQLLMSAVDPEAALKVILESALRLFQAAGCSLALLDETTNELAFVAMAGATKVEEFRVPVSQGLGGWVARTGVGVVSNDVSTDSRFYGGVDQQTGFITRSILCAPLKQREQLIGVIETLNTTKPGGFNDEDLQLLTAFGGLAGTAITQTRMFSRVHNANVAFQEVLQGRYRLVNSTSPAMQDVLRTARTAAPSNATVLLLGESGTGKEVLARAIHQWSPRAEHPFVAINCVTLTPELLASELFGHERGAFTGAVAQKKGKFELADGGTVFLDEIGDLAPDLQTKLLRVLQDREFQRVGGVKDIRTNVRILAATNRDLRQAMHHGTFREDLYYRLNVVSITLPPLRERRQDIPHLVRHFIEHYCQEVNRTRLGITQAAMEILCTDHWPGNVRELQNVIERAVVLATGVDIMAVDFPMEIRQEAILEKMPHDVPPDPGGLPLSEAVKAFKRAKVLQALEFTSWNQSQAARHLGLQPANLSRLMATLGLRDKGGAA